MRLVPWRSREERVQTTTLANPAPWLLDSAGVIATYSGERVSIDRALEIGPFFSAVKLISETVGMLPLKVYRDLPDGTRVEADQHRTWGFLHDAPNPAMDATRFWATAAVHYLLWGNVFIEKLRGEDGLVNELWLWHPGEITVQWNQASLMKQFVREAGGSRQMWDQDTMLHIVGFSLDGVIGQPITKARQTLGTALARETFEGSFYKNGGMRQGALKHPKALSEQAHRNIGESFRAMFGRGAKDAHRIPVFEEGMDWIDMSMSLTDLQFVELKQMTRAEVATLFNLPLGYLGASTGDSLTYSTVESNQIQYAQLTIAPIVNAIGKALSNDASIFPQRVFFAEFALEGIYRGDAASRVAYYKGMSEVKAITVNEIRARENLPRFDEGDEIPGPVNIKPVPEQALPPPPPPPGSQAAKDLAAAAPGGGS